MVKKLIEIIKKNYVDSLIKNSIYLIFTNFTDAMLGFFFWLIASRYYSTNDIGITAAMLSSMSLISIISLIGFPTALMFYLPRNMKIADRIINSCLLISIIISFVLSIIFILGSKIWASGLTSTFTNFKYTSIFVITTTATTVSAIMSGAFTAGKRSSFHMIKENIFGFIKIIPLILFIEFGGIGIFLSWGIGIIITVVIGYFLLSKLWKYQPMIVIDPIIKKMASFSAGNYISVILYNSPRLIFPIIILNIISARFSGIFFITMTMAGLLYGISQSISSSLLAETHDIKKLKENINRAVLLNTYLLIPGILLFVIFGKFILNLFNPIYSDGATTLTIFAIASIPVSMNNIFIGVRNVQKRILIIIKVNGIISLTTIILSIPLMKIMNIEGAAISFLVANSIMAIIIIFKMRNSFESILRIFKEDNSIKTIRTEL